MQRARQILLLQLSLVGVVVNGSGSGCTKEGVPLVEQRPFTVKATSKLTSRLFLRWTGGEASAFSFGAADGATWRVRGPIQPPCVESCSSVPQGLPCGLSCKPAFTMIRAFDPGESVSFAWTGSFYLVLNDHCEQSECFVASPPGAGRHRATLCGTNAWSCVEADPNNCPQEIGTWRGEPKGAQRCFHAEFTIPYEAQVLEIVLEQTQAGSGG